MIPVNASPDPPFASPEFPVVFSKDSLPSVMNVLWPFKTIMSFNSLAFVMAGAITMHAFAYRLIRRRKSPLFSSHFHVRTSRDLTPSLIIGALIFGVGWALAGFCPGPALASLASLNARPIIFVVSMILGMAFFRGYQKLISKKRS